MGSLARKMRRANNKGATKAQDAMLAVLDDNIATLRQLAEGSPQMCQGVKEAMRRTGHMPTDLVTPFVHVEQSAWLGHLHMDNGRGDAAVARGGYLSGPVFFWEELAVLNNTIDLLLSRERAAAMRDRMASMSLAFVMHANGRFDAFYYDYKRLSASDAQRAEEFAHLDHLGYSD